MFRIILVMANLTAGVLCIAYPFAARSSTVRLDDIGPSFLLVGTLLLLNTWFVIMDRKRSNQIWRIAGLWLDTKEKELERRRDGK
jgi:hypothetical protein